jgi:NitT/TauT family transport system substrate-binding protein
MHWATRVTSGAAKPVAGMALLLALTLLASACGGDGSAGGGDGGADAAATGAAEEEAGSLRQISAAIPFPGGIPFFPILVAQDRGYLAEEGIELTDVQPVDGSGAVVQQIATGQVDVGFPSPSPLLSAVEGGEDLVSTYLLYQSNVFQVVVPADSDIQSLADLEGRTLGLVAPDAGSTNFARAILFAEHGLQPEADFDELRVGDGGTAAVAIDRGDVDAYTAAFPDIATIRLRGIDVRNILPDEYAGFPDSLLVLPRADVEADPAFVEGLGRAMAKATVWGSANPEEVLEITTRWFPEEAQDRDFAMAMLEETIALFQLPDGAEGWGYHRPDALGLYVDYLVQQGSIEGTAGLDVFVNDHVAAYNDFDDADL